MSSVDENMRVQRERAEGWRRALMWDNEVVDQGTVDEVGEDSKDGDMYNCA
jgi:hypothetical protein